MLTSFTRITLLCALICASTAVCAQRDEDPESSQSWLTKFAEHDARDGRLWAGTIRATDDFGATHDRDFRLTASGSIARGDRKVVLNRYEPECFEFAPAARLSLDDYCDQLTLTWRGEDATIAFSSLDANRRYSFTLRADPRSPGAWTSLTPNVPAPTLRLTSGNSNGDVSYRWELGTREATYRQAGEVTASQARGADLHPVEIGLLGLGEVLLTFNRYAFERSLLPRNHPDYEPTPYSAWASETTEGGCIFTFCFGNLGGNGGSAGNNYDACTPGHPNYNPANCPHDLTYARWPVGIRPKLQKLSNSQVRVRAYLKNVGTGDMYVETATGLPDPSVVFFSLIRLGSGSPLVSANSIASSPYGEQCYRDSSRPEQGGEIVNPFVLVDLKAGEAKPISQFDMTCAQNSTRPAGRYRLYIHVDPYDAYDTPGLSGNNIGNSGPFDWVHLRN